MPFDAIEISCANARTHAQLVIIVWAALQIFSIQITFTKTYLVSTSDRDHKVVWSVIHQEYYQTDFPSIFPAHTTQLTSFPSCFVGS